MAKIELLRKSKRTPEELREASKHLFWGMRYLSERLEFFLRLSNRVGSGDVGGFLNSIHDSFLVHSRKMTEFFYCTANRVYDNDLIAEDYFESPEIWRELRPSPPNILEHARADVGKLIAHFTYQVKDYPSGRLTWETSDIYVAIFTVLQKFLSEVDQSLIHHEFNYLREENKDIIICRPIYPPHAKAPYQIACRRDRASGVTISDY